MVCHKLVNGVVGVFKVFGCCAGVNLETLFLYDREYTLPVYENIVSIVGRTHSPLLHKHTVGFNKGCESVISVVRVGNLCRFVEIGSVFGMINFVVLVANQVHGVGKSRFLKQTTEYFHVWSTLDKVGQLVV